MAQSCWSNDWNMSNSPERYSASGPFQHRFLIAHKRSFNDHPQNADHIPAATSFSSFKHLHTTLGSERVGLLLIASNIRIHHYEFWCATSTASRPSVRYGYCNVCLGCHLSTGHASHHPHNIRSICGVDHILGHPRLVHLVLGEHCGAAAEPQQVNSHRRRSHCIAIACGHSRRWLHTILLYEIRRSGANADLRQKNRTGRRQRMDLWYQFGRRTGAHRVLGVSVGRETGL